MAYTVADFQRDLAEPYAWPGGYPRYFVTKDGGVLSYASAIAEQHLIILAIDNYDDPQWQVVACEVNWEDEHLYCDMSAERIPPAYGDDPA